MKQRESLLQKLQTLNVRNNEINFEFQTYEFKCSIGGYSEFQDVKKMFSFYTISLTKKKTFFLGSTFLFNYKLGNEINFENLCLYDS